jgi:hypothetical protein
MPPELRIREVTTADQRRICEAAISKLSMRQLELTLRQSRAGSNTALSEELEQIILELERLQQNLQTVGARLPSDRGCVLRSSARAAIVPSVARHLSLLFRFRRMFLPSFWV